MSWCSPVGKIVEGTAVGITGLEKSIVGDAVVAADGASVNSEDGDSVGSKLVGESVGLDEGGTVGDSVGLLVGKVEGLEVGDG